MSYLQIIGIAFVTALTSLLLKNTKPELSFAVVVAGSILILVFLCDMVKENLSIFKKLAQLSSLSNVMIKSLLKIVGIGYLTEFSANILCDFGSNSVADKVVLGGKIVILILTLPIVEKLLELILSFLALL